jgi:pimeloyl-ACP methyl ester carboxylesterase
MSILPPRRSSGRRSSHHVAHLGGALPITSPIWAETRHDGRVSVPTVVLLHGQPDSSASFWSLTRELRPRLPSGVRVVAPDRPGYGANPLPAPDYAGPVRWLRRWLR